MSQYSKRKPTDHKLSELAKERLPDAELYSQLREAEQRLDTLITRKRLDLQDVIGRSVRRNKTLRLFVSSTIHNPPWEKPANSDAMELESAFEFGNQAPLPLNQEPPSWTLRIEGRLVDDEESNHRLFSTMFTSIIVELRRVGENEQYDSEALGGVGTFQPEPMPMQPASLNNDGQNAPQNPGNGDSGAGEDGSAANTAASSQPSEVVEWHEIPPGTNEHPIDFDGLDIRRRGDGPVRAKIIMQLKEYPDKFKLSPALADVLGVNQKSKPGVVVSLWQYIRSHKLQDVDEKRLIKCDAALKTLFGRDTATFPELVELLAPHLRPREPIVIDYLIDPTIELENRDLVFDVPLQIDDRLRQDLIEMLDTWPEYQGVLRQYDDRVLDDVQRLNYLAQQREFYEQFADSPGPFLERWVASQARDLKIIYSDRQFSEEAVRHSSFFTSDALNQSIHLFLNNR